MDFKDTIYTAAHSYKTIQIKDIGNMKIINNSEYSPCISVGISEVSYINYEDIIVDVEKMTKPFMVYYPICFIKEKDLRFVINNNNLYGFNSEIYRLNINTGISFNNYAHIINIIGREVYNSHHYNVISKK